ncbi:MAG: hypothetical protein LBJ46_08150 [Planctomycetota bacterium]|jgi:hypothetical protein|nr:hypothetical protein [Planctomycetota bacterium]
MDATAEYHRSLAQAIALIALIHGRTEELNRKEKADWGDVGDAGALREDLLKAAGRAFGRPDINLPDALKLTIH